MWDQDGIDYSHKSEQDINTEAFYWTLWHNEQAELNRYKHVLDDGALARLRACESNGNYAIVSSNGAYRGAYQFSQSTWNSVANRHFGGRFAGVSPNDVPAEWQDAFTRALYSEHGRSPWPVCGKRI